jgi:hypothetical protein
VASERPEFDGYTRQGVRRSIRDEVLRASIEVGVAVCRWEGAIAEIVVVQNPDVKKPSSRLPKSQKSPCSPTRSALATGG